MKTLHVDCESRSAVDLKATGVYVYAEDPTTDIWCLAYAFDDGPVELWIPDDVMCPPAIAEHVRAGGTLVAHNANFERAIWHYVLAARYGWPEPKVEQWTCTMVMAYGMSLPGALDNMLGALGTDAKKDMAGHRLMMSMSQPRRTKTEGLTWWDDPAKLERLYTYCKDDVVGERAGGDRLVRLRPSELDLWHLDQRINDRGVYVDTTLALKAKAIVAHVTDKLNREMASVTDWNVTACSNVSQLKAWVRERGVDTEALDREAIGELLIRTDLPDDVRRALELRQEAGRASVAKINALLNGTSADGRAKGLLQFLAADSGRWGGRRFQPQNIRRPSEDANPDDAIDIILNNPPARAAALLEMLYGPVLTVISDVLRGMVRAAPGKRLYSADYANIEGRVLAWLAGESKKLDAFRAYDEGRGPDLYLVTAADILGVPVGSLNKKSPERQSYGKVPELACGYQGSVGAFQVMAHTYGIKVTDEKALAIVQAWRAKNPAIVQYWRDLDEATFDAVAHPGALTSVRDTKFKVVGSFLWMQLPSSRAICFPYPAIAWKDMPWLNESTGLPAKRQVVSFKGVNSYTRKWETMYLYGGKIANYVTQGTARDIMAAAMPRIEAAGYSIILSVHDELVCETPEDFGSVDEYERLMVELPPWAAGLPVAAEAYTAMRYHK